MTKIRTEQTISAAHIVHTPDGKCSRLHGHNWKIIVEIEGKIKAVMYRHVSGYGAFTFSAQLFEGVGGSLKHMLMKKRKIEK